MSASSLLHRCVRRWFRAQAFPKSDALYSDTHHLPHALYTVAARSGLGLRRRRGAWRLGALFTCAADSDSACDRRFHLDHL